jgi:hypothetical protein
MLASILPAVFPIVVAGTLLRLLGDGLQFASVVALTVSAGAECHDSFPKSATTGGTGGRWLGRQRQARDHSGRTGIDPHIRGSVMRTYRNGVLQFARVADVRLAQLTILRPTVTFLRSAFERTRLVRR